jgi:hypothetical protein
MCRSACAGQHLLAWLQLVHSNAAQQRDTKPTPPRFCARPRRRAPLRP